MEYIEQIILTNQEREDLVKAGYRKMQMTPEGTIQVAKEKEDYIIPKDQFIVVQRNGIESNLLPEGLVCWRWKWVDWPFKEKG